MVMLNLIQQVENLLYCINIKATYSKPYIRIPILCECKHSIIAMAYTPPTPIIFSYIICIPHHSTCIRSLSLSPSRYSKAKTTSNVEKCVYNIT